MMAGLGGQFNKFFAKLNLPGGAMTSTTVTVFLIIFAWPTTVLSTTALHYRSAFLLLRPQSALPRRSQNAPKCVQDDLKKFLALCCGAAILYEDLL